MTSNSRTGAGRPVTLGDVARLAGVSVSTASNALTGARQVSALSIERVLAAAAHLGYRRNEVARSLRTGRRMAIGLVIPDITDPFFAGIVRHIEDRANALDWSLLLCDTHFDSDREVAYLARLSSSADGILLFSTRPDARTVKPLVDLGIPVVACDERIELAGIGGVYSDSREGAASVARMFLDAGVRRFGVLKGPESLSTAQDRRDGFVATLRAAGVDNDDILCVSVPYSLDGGRDGIRELLTRRPDIGAVFASTDMQAIGALFESRSRGYAVPDDLLIAGFDGIDWTEHTQPTLTTVRQDVEGMAERAFDMLTAIIAGEAEPTVEVLPVELVQRQSTARGGRPAVAT